MKRIVILGAVVVLLTVGLSGCTTQDIADSKTDTDKSSYSDYVKLSNVKVVTKWGWGTSAGEAQGFIHGIESRLTPKYEVSGTVKNIADRPIDEVRIKITFKDDSGNVITTRSPSVRDLYMGDSKSFTSSVGSGYSEPYFEYISNYVLEIYYVDFH